MPHKSTYRSSASRKPKAGHTVTPTKAKKILREGTAQGRPLTKKQRGFFGARAGGAPVRRTRTKSRSR